ncbi:MAG: hypothetical protein Q8R24_00720 [Legionellaceae bacterium]|nr:hypothetical protein [Legionellaceae bacterium]
MRNLLITTYKFNLLDQSDKKNMHTLLTSPQNSEEVKTLFAPLLEHCNSDFLNQPVMHTSMPFLIYFMQEKQYSKIEPVLKKGADVNCRYDNGNTLLMHLILSDVQFIPEKYELIHLVLAYHPDLETLKNNENKTVLDLVRLSTDEKIIELFNDYLGDILEPQKRSYSR